MKKNKTIIILQLLIPMIICSSCWDGIEINRRSVIFSLGIDKNMSQDNNPDIDSPKRYSITYAIPDMAKVSGDESISEEVVTAETAESTTFLTSIEEVQTRTRDTINFGHTKAILLGSDLLKDPIMMKEIIDSLERNMLFTRSTPLFAVRGRAEEVIDVDNKQYPMIGLYIMNYVNNKERAVSRYKEALLGNTIRELRENNTAIIPIIGIIEDSKIEIQGGALLKDFQLVTWFSPEEVRGILWAEGKVKGASIPIPVGDSYLSYTVRKQDSKITFTKDGDEIYCNIDIINEGEIGEYYINSNNSLSKDSNIKEIEKEVSGKIKSEVDHLIAQTKSYDTDIIGLETELYRQHPKWQARPYKDIQVNVTVDTKIRRIGIIE